MSQYTPEQVEKVADHLANGTPNWFRESFGDWKGAVHTIDRAPKDAAGMLRAYAATLRQPSADSGRVHESAEDRFEQYVKTLIDKAPDVQKLGERLAHLLDDDQFNNIEPTLLGIAAALAAQGQGEGEPVAWLCDNGDSEKLMVTVSQRGRDAYAALGRTITPLYTHPAPAASPAGVPDGYVLVPREPTQEMLRAIEAQWGVGSATDMARREYFAVLAAAPSAKPEGDGGACGCPCEPSGSDGLRCPGKDGRLLCDPTRPTQRAAGE